MRATLLATLAVAACGGSHSAGTDGGGGGGDGPRDGSGSGSGSADAAVCPASCTAGQWCTESAPIASSTVLDAVAVFGGKVYAFGTGGTIIARDCTGWSQVTSPTTSYLKGAWATATSLWVVGDSGTVLQFDGTTWNPVTGLTQNLLAVWGSSDSDVWAVSMSGSASHWNGSAWATTSIGGVLLAVSGSAPDNVWTAAESGYVHQYTTTWSAQIDPSGNPTYFAALARSATNVWVTSAVSGKETQNYNGSTWTAHSTSGNVIQALWGRADNDLWGTGSLKVAHWDGGSWTFTQPTGVTMPLEAVTGTATDVYIVGAGAMILHRD